ncbi:hypothetical protein A2567_01410 [Candidatus Azambacteria bacterium RIFOXYD1_FULL_42_11]|uniref:Uncharacterized protein n=4 Tax=Candidatus Azamiibacteriota TaxID=1752741 RepID=A0A0G0ZAJ2_9BACT|nr:MAG: hypothetical protein UV07_C0012G0012 [Candidatus Azambacteria bacterium GW2011_GWB1_42_17]KKS45649.1 MAG: hypothetical protein UV10_C0017G0015 [Candidatus Azambacteria bacterium GW2011_GWA1_42_19]KKS75440.1 MAG: hypothetical protein UV48_C0012G0012 [Candidatus Azambacteria bacterium GW2011_GWA2_42_9]KKS88091.1 MAG: hypothetical protein UV62_C0015G0012 [Parcubacteria group bacterium GW2011_GWC1_43_11]OGD42309.1 MAG: hypothetical protein A2567_01410 [Candidatus Azambacteria bacterium RIFO
MNTSKTWIWILIVVVVLALAWTAWQYGFLSRLEAPLSSDDTTTAIDKDLNAVDVGNPDQDLKQLDTDLNQL